jgi:hypothetical protein
MFRHWPHRGNTATCLSFVWRDRVFCGGLMAADACSYQPWPVQPEAMWDSVNRHIFPLPNETLLFSGHSRQARWCFPRERRSMKNPCVVKIEIMGGHPVRSF